MEQIDSACADLTEARHAGEIEAVDAVLVEHDFTDGARIPQLLADHAEPGPVGCRGSAFPASIDAVPVQLHTPESDTRIVQHTHGVAVLRCTP